MKKTNLMIIGAVFSALLSTLCCLPAFLFLFFGISSGVLSFFPSLEFTRVPLAILSSLFFLISVYNFRKKISCACSKNDRVKQYIILCFLSIFILSLVFYPEILPLFME